MSKMLSLLREAAVKIHEASSEVYKTRDTEVEEKLNYVEKKLEDLIQTLGIRELEEDPAEMAKLERYREINKKLEENPPVGFASPSYYRPIKR